VASSLAQNRHSSTPDIAHDPQELTAALPAWPTRPRWPAARQMWTRFRPGSPCHPTPHPPSSPRSCGRSTNSAPPTPSAGTAPTRTAATPPTSATAPHWSSRRTRSPVSPCPRTSQDQFHAGSPVPDITQLRPGDLVCVPGAVGTMTAPRPRRHYLGSGLVIDAPTTDQTVHIGPLRPNGAAATWPSSAESPERCRFSLNWAVSHELGGVLGGSAICVRHRAECFPIKESTTEAFASEESVPST
jgi:hypothetical protein